MNEIIEFGKYKGQPIEALASDPKYMEWLASQPWLKDRHPTIYNIIVNNFSESEETPEHNRLQARFMDESFANMVGENVFAGLVHELAEDRKYTYKNGSEEITDWPVDEFKYFGVSEIEFEVSGIDVRFCVEYGGYYNRETKNSKGEVVKTRKSYRSAKRISAELKPIVGDDYPAILREMVHKKCNLLIYENFKSEAIDENKLEKFFATREIKILSTKNLS